ncbi:DUF6528 family protein [Kitasatospora sp. NPDC096147]|uniref:DUF6528 family protein n=1 Tax=Kitasatospora sp. NPDC096147 TaxID=3364093 RepID=UPI00382906D3
MSSLRRRPSSPRPSRSLLALAVCVSVLTGATGARAYAAQPALTPVALTDQLSGAVLVLAAPLPQLGPRRPPVIWSWSPGAAPELAALRGSTWGLTESKLRRHDGHRYLLATASGGLAALVDQRSRKVRWAVNTGPGNPHSIELLPDGNVAVASSVTGQIRLYTASQGPHSDHYTWHPLAGAHGVHWDGARGLLWALGSTELTALRPGGTPAAPTLTPVRTVALPGLGGHDLAPAPGTPGRLWIAARDRVWQYDPADDGFTPQPLPAGGGQVKSIDQDPATGRLMTVSPEPDPACPWCSSALTLRSPELRRELAGLRFYKARWWYPLDR